ncbi:hypothetical protein V9T40_006348 [Parthenolecanium corni]|uniref:40S ribosomal protein S25 n=1 Tax=Parthenolecanium corni TaxID=536013 RepID=A0AAN9Y7B5_9HEMI
MAPKKDAKGASSKQPQKTQKKKEGGSGGKAKKKKWSKGKVRDKLNNQVLFDKASYEKLFKEVPSYKLITPSVVSERLKVRGSLARKALNELLEKDCCYLPPVSISSYRLDDPLPPPPSSTTGYATSGHSLVDLVCVSTAL